MPKVKQEYHIDLSEPADERWSEMIESEVEETITLIDNSNFQIDEYLGGTIGGAIRKVVQWIYDLYGNEYADDIDAWADGCGIPRRDLVYANLTYEISQAAESRKIPVPFCTSVAFNLPNAVAHVRNMDWPLEGVGPMTRIIHYDGPCGPFTSVGWPGYIGVLSGSAKGRFSATINYAPAHRRVRPHWPASFALRRTFEECADFEEAVDFLVDTKMAAAALFMVVGTEPNEAVVIEHKGMEASCRYMRGGVLAMTNHYVKKENLKHNEDDEILSGDRYAFALDAGRNAGSPRISSMPNILGEEPVLNDQTAQQMAFVPKTGKYKVLYHDTDENLLE